MPIKEHNKLSDEQTAVNQKLKNIENILDDAQKTTEMALAVSRKKDSDSIDEPQVAYPSYDDIPAIVFSVDSGEGDKLARNISKKKKKDKEVIDHFSDSDKSENIDDLLDVVKPGFGKESEGNISDTDSEDESVEYEQTSLFDSEEAETEENKLIDKIIESDDYNGDDFDNLTERVLNSKLVETTKEGQVSHLESEDKVHLSEDREALDETDINLRLAFDMLDDSIDVPDEIKNLPENEIFDKVTHRKKKRPKEKSKELENEVVFEDEEEQYTGYEYESHEQDGEIESFLKKAVKGWRIKSFIVLLFTVGILFLERATKASDLYPIFLKPGRYGLLYILVDLQLLLFIAITMMGSLRKGIRDLFKLTATVDTLLFVSILLPIAHTTYVIWTDPTDPSLMLYNLGGAATAFFVAVAKYLQSKRDLDCFEIISDERPKFAAESLRGGTKEADEFYKYLLEDSEIYTVKRTDFIKGFFKRISSRAKTDDIILWQIFIVIIAAVLVFALNYIKGSSVFDSYRYASALIATALPLTAIFVSILPTYKSNKIARRSESALIGNAFTEEYDAASVISFADTEVFPASNVKLTSLKTYGDFRIDKVIQDIARVFKKLGGPLSTVFTKALTEEILPFSKFRLIECSTDGILVSAEGRDIYIGKRSYMRNYMFDIVVDDGDAEFEAGNGSIMYVGINDELAAKLYLRYRINPRFDALLKDMYKAGVCVGIKTLDPNISNELLARSIRFKKCPIAILKADKPEDITGKVDAISSAIATNGTLHTFLRMFVLCDKTRHSIKSNLVLSVASMVLSIAIVAFLSLTDTVQYMNSFYALLFQLLWLFPVGVMSYLS